MALQEFGLGFVIGGALSSSFKSAFKESNTSIININSNINKLSKTRVDIKNFKKLSLDAIKNKTSLAKLSTTLKKSGIDVNNLDQDARLLRTSLIKLKQASKIDIKITGIKNKLAEQKASILGLGAAMYGVTGIIKGANTVLKAQGEIRSLDISTKGIDAITKSGHNMSLQFGQITAPKFVKASYDIKSGIASLSEDGVNQFTKFSAVTAVATKSSTEEMTKLYALGYGIFREDFTSDISFGKQFSGAIAGAVQAFRTDGADLAAGISNVGASAKAMGVSLEEEIAIIGLSKSAFASASEAGSGYRAFLDGAGKAQKKLGLSFIDSQGKILPMAQILGKIKEKYGDLDLAEIGELKDGFGSSEAIKTITALLPKVDELESAQKNLKASMDSGLSKSQAMAKAMDSGYGFEKMGNAMSYFSFTIGKAVAPAVDMLASGLGSLAKGVAWLDEKVPFLIPVFTGLTAGVIALVTVLKIGTLAKLAFSFATNTVKKSILLSTASNLYNALSYNSLSVSSSLATAKTWAFNIATKATSITQGIFSASTSFLSARLTALGALLNFTRIKSLAFAAGSGAATAAQWLFNAALTANPIGLVIAGLAALGAGAVYLYKNFEPFTNFIDGVWGKLKSFFSFVSDGWAIVGDMISGVASFFGFGDDDSEQSTKDKKFKQNKNSTTGLPGAEKAADFLKTKPTNKTKLWENKVTQQEVKLWGSKSTNEEPKKTKLSLVKKSAAIAIPALMATQLAAAPVPIQSQPAQPKLWERKPVSKQNVIPERLSLKPVTTFKQAVYAPPIKPLNKEMTEPKKPQQTQQVTQHITIDVKVENPSDNVDVERAIVNAMREHGKSSTSMMDEEI